MGFKKIELQVWVSNRIHVKHTLNGKYAHINYLYRLTAAFSIIIDQPYCVLSRFSCVWLFATAWTVDCQAPLSMEFPKQEYWSGLLFPPPGDLPKWGTELSPLALADRFFTTEPPGKPQYWGLNIFILLIYSCQFKMCLSALLYGSSRWVWIYGSPACLETLG